MVKPEVSGKEYDDVKPEASGKESEEIKPKVSGKEYEDDVEGDGNSNIKEEYGYEDRESNIAWELGSENRRDNDSNTSRNCFSSGS